jgi:aerobic-type carbon monoxide dehydrogenase small subunit (CoxS/CutS family)
MSIEHSESSDAHRRRRSDDPPLLYVLSDDLQLHGPKFGCDLSQCGACTAIVDEEATDAGETSITAVPAAIGNAVFDATGAKLRQMPFTPERE